ncbi:MAG: hypothetical protein A2918_00090 [Candidatus Yanofskybacteria bacterium RIFCSPLOWO2_01_FULL_42_49]|uniref:Polymer-forming cytoskeletal protein n=1 Tax=Candidatus Yanofskybacteria bacterium RIFCSPLOWO2_01_FULL_42_49 TaxID=1802694 RepID=A0A1F8GC49_9BACT|nr:MAG: hypothetical protein A2918_00090 [Candidatus Yanofskybacteria bacterium RIFCSPLOWO2_01_FULL_42_49]
MKDKHRDVVMMVDGVKFYRHPNGGGLVAETAQVAPTVHIAPKAKVSGKAILEDFVRVTGRARVEGTVYASEYVTFGGNSVTTEGTYSGHKLIY